MTLNVSPAELQRSGSLMDDCSELVGSLTIDGGESGTFGSGILAVAASVFATHTTSRLSHASQRASTTAEALRTSQAGFESTDQQAAEVARPTSSRRGSYRGLVQ